MYKLNNFYQGKINKKIKLKKLLIGRIMK